jgi:hypothetical protein
LGDRLLIEHRRHGRALLSAAHIMGVPTFLALSRSGGKLDWRDAVTAFETLPRDATQATRDGLLLVVECGLDHRGIPTSALERISRVGDGFRSLVSIVPDRRRLLNLFGDDRLIELVTIGMAKDQPFTEAAARIWPTQVWQRYSRDGKRFDALYSIASYRRDEFGQPPDALAEEVAGQDELTPVYLDVGIEGVRLWDAHVTPGSGEHQRQLANRAIGLFKKGYPPNDLQTTEGVRLAEIFDWLPGGLSLYHVLAPLGRWAFVLLGGFVLVVLMMTVFVARRLISRMAPSIRRAAK